MGADQRRATAALKPQLLRALTLDAATHPRAQPHVSAASGLVCHAGRVFVVADDEHHLAVFDDASAPGRLLPLFEGALPADATERKRVKPDCEALLQLPPWGAAPHGALLAWGSGSRPQRERGALLRLDRAGAPAGAAEVIDLSGLIAPLRERYADLNLEGALLLGESFVLLQRGTQAGSPNAALHYRAHDLRALLDGRIHTLAPLDEVRYDLGRLDGLALGFTDAAALPGGGWAYTAAAEDTDDPYLDGACAGSVIGLVNAQGRLGTQWRLAGHDKIEGIAVQADGRRLWACLVSDADDPARAACLWRVVLPLR
ncbi:hypothetical protein HLB44_14370 [Aquincola sp. S2]|uniref:DUF3616 domain-containing protein n=1 Tax=Pseudaquabacterium terrae TaxID=2732868 RepID=A0ABX2EHP9_9BURK|nr:hypothetical protein [Aquabacterium terrae]NRF68175.1 hypothetical protein [Aquabacterium terrae]